LPSSQERFTKNTRGSSHTSGLNQNHSNKKIVEV
jgi:hypothetical protein